MPGPLTPKAIAHEISMNRLWYPLALLIFGLGIYITLDRGSRLEAPSPASTVTGIGSHPLTAEAKAQPPTARFTALKEGFQDPLSVLLLQLILIVLAARICGIVAKGLGQTAVIGEMLAGILLGPSLMGWASPGAFHFLFPDGSLGTLRLLSQIGVCLFMFVVGMELDVTKLRGQARTAVLVSQISILFPYLLGVVSALFLFSSFAAPGTKFLSFALFLGISLSITAFPVLARILAERGLTKTPLGSTALACAAIDDVTAWTILGFVVAIVKAGDLLGAAFTILLVAGFVAGMLFWIKPVLARWIEPVATGPARPGTGLMAGIIVFLFASALTTDLLGIHALFGSFLAGVVMPPRGEFREALKVRLEMFSSVFLLPLFFAFTGLRTQIGSLTEPSAWLICAGLILLATIGKLGGAMLTARMTGVGWTDSFALGALMNTRGLMELVALNIGYDLGILSATIFTMLVIMALVTTALTAPLLSLSDHFRTRNALKGAVGIEA